MLGTSGLSNFDEPELTHRPDLRIRAQEKERGKQKETRAASALPTMPAHSDASAREPIAINQQTGPSVVVFGPRMSYALRGGNAPRLD